MTPLWKRLALWLMYAEMPYAWVAYVLVLFLGALLVPWEWLRCLLYVPGFLIVWFHLVTPRL